jgi:hypothetical protein
MANPRLPALKAEVSGATVKNPQRFADRSGVRRARPIGEPYKTMSDREIEQWHEFVRDLPWLNSSHRVLLKLACRLTCQMDDGDFGVSKALALGSILSKLAATPVDETKVSAPDDDEDSPADKYFN